MSKKILKCPYCGSTRANRTGLGWAESAAKGIGAFGVGLVVASFNHVAGHKTTENIILFKGVQYNIVRVDVFEGYKSDLTIYCKRQA